MSDSLLSYGMHDIILSASFPECGKRFQVSLDLSEWDDIEVDENVDLREGLTRIAAVDSDLRGGSTRRLSKDKVFTLQVDFTQLRICVGDFGVTIPFTLFCFRLPSLLIQRNTVAGNIVADLSIGIANFKWRRQDMELAAFHLGEAGKCFPIKSRQQCLFTKGCGYCEATKQCMKVDAHKQSDECSFCPRCSFFTSEDNRGECLAKESCGWCSPNQDESGICEIGDSLGPYGASDCVVQNMDTHQLVGWTYDRKEDRTLASVFGILFAMTCAMLLLVLTTVAGCLLYRKIRYGSAWGGAPKETYAQVE